MARCAYTDMGGSKPEAKPTKQEYTCLFRIVREKEIGAELHDMLHMFDDEGTRACVKGAHSVLRVAEIEEDEDEDTVTGEVPSPNTP